ncbi:Lrp/AsnC family transcriptional regulator [Pelistega europaea]|uniref:Lrp/AsnC family transcriptional regulator n=1 Tax=Pelistega europaea TaxID=106147 RepID=A0A7Y4P4G5_9BURK|nr:Lrp/AsnC family transcriptional regulator [Pelistega europaea]NOL48688.1 Lrp/AsnC family transcriptional regulator [Pelistega europaea]
MDLDELDKRILEQLQKDASLTNQELAEKVFASAPTCLRRVRQLEQKGIIQKRVALLDAGKLAPSLTAIVEINLLQQSSEVFSAFEKLLVNEAAILQCYRVSSGPDFMVILQVPDMNAYHELANRLFTAQHQVRNVRTFFATHRSKFETRVRV